MEDSAIIILSTLLMVGSLVGLKFLRGETKLKQGKRQVTESAQREVIDSKDLTITTLKDELRSMKGKFYRNRALEAEEEEEDPEDSRVPVTFEQITALVNQHYPKYAKLLPLAKKQIMEATKGLSMEEILSYVKQFTGNQQPQGNTNPESAQYNPNWA